MAEFNLQFWMGQILNGPPHALRGRDLSGLNLGTVDLSRFDLTDTDLSGCTFGPGTKFPPVLNRTSLYGARLHGADFTSAKLHNVDFQGATFHGRTRFNGALVYGGTVENALGLDKADFTGATLDGLWAQQKLPAKVANPPKVRPPLAGREGAMRQPVRAEKVRGQRRMAGAHVGTAGTTF